MTLLNSKYLPLLWEGNVTVTTAGTPVQISTIKGKRAYIQSVEANEEKKLVVGDANVDGTTTPPVCRRVLYPTQAEIFEQGDTSQIYLDADQNNTVAHVAIYG